MIITYIAYVNKKPLSNPASSQQVPGLLHL